MPALARPQTANERPESPQTLHHGRNDGRGISKTVGERLTATTKYPSSLRRTSRE